MAEREEPSLDRIRDAMRQHDEQLREDERDDAAREAREAREPGEDEEHEGTEDDEA
jgi:hypothetical protein